MHEDRHLRFQRGAASRSCAISRRCWDGHSRQRLEARMVNAIMRQGFFGVYATWLGQFRQSVCRPGQHPGRGRQSLGQLGDLPRPQPSRPMPACRRPRLSPLATLSGQPGFTGSTTGYVLHLVNPFNPVTLRQASIASKFTTARRTSSLISMGLLGPGHVNIPYTSGESPNQLGRPSWRQSTLRGCPAFMPRGWGNSATSISARSISKAWRPVPAATR